MFNADRLLRKKKEHNSEWAKLQNKRKQVENLKCRFKSRMSLERTVFKIDKFSDPSFSVCWFLPRITFGRLRSTSLTVTLTGASRNGQHWVRRHGLVSGAGRPQAIRVMMRGIQVMVSHKIHQVVLHSMLAWHCLNYQAMSWWTIKHIGDGFTKLFNCMLNDCGG